VYGKILSLPGAQIFPAISGTHVVWMQQVDEGFDVYCKNIATGVYGKILSSTEEQIMAAIDGTKPGVAGF
jgi:hypothetical protein